MPLQRSPTQLQGRPGTNAHRTQPHPEENNFPPEQGKERAHSIDSPVRLLPEAPAHQRTPVAAASGGVPPSSESSCGTCRTGSHPGASNQPQPCQPPAAQTITRGKCLLPAAPRHLEMQTALRSDNRERVFLRLEMSRKPTLRQNETPPEGLEGAQGLPRTMPVASTQCLFSPHWTCDSCGSVNIVEHVQTSLSTALRSTENAPEVTTVTSKCIVFLSQSSCTTAQESPKKGSALESTPSFKPTTVLEKLPQTAHTAQPKSSSIINSLKKNPSGQSSTGRQT